MGIPFFILTVAEGFTDFVPGMSGVRCDVIRNSVKKLLMIEHFFPTYVHQQIRHLLGSRSFSAELCALKRLIRDFTEDV